MLGHINLSNIIYLDIETVPQCAAYEELSDVHRVLWDKKAESLLKGEPRSAADIYQRAGIYAEFGRIVCISLGVYAPNEAGKLRVKSFYGDDEVALLAGFSDALERFANKRQYYLCAHNGKEFDFPYIARRMVINGMPLPRILDVAGRKPWEVPFLDTMELWKFGDFKHYTSLHLLTTVLNIPTPKDDIDGSMVAEVYYTLGDVRRIASYCEKDVVAVAQIMRRYKGEPLLDANDIELVP